VILSAMGDRPAVERDFRLALLDQVAWALVGATGRAQLVQAIWVYDRRVDRAGLQRFVDAFAAGTGNRVVEPARVRFARARWVRPLAAPIVSDDGSVRPRADLLAWADECVDPPLDPEAGPAWRVAVQDFDDGSGAVAMTVSHVIGDAHGGFQEIGLAIAGRGRDPGYAEAGSRGRVASTTADLGQVVRDLPDTIRGLRAWWRTGGRGPRPVDPRSASPDDDRTIAIPAVVARVEFERWNRCGREAGGNAATLLAAFTVDLAVRVGHTGADGLVTLVIPTNLREGPDDLRANAFGFGRVAVPAAAGRDHARLRSALDKARTTATVGDGPEVEMVALVPWLTRRSTLRLADRIFDYAADLPTSLSNLGILPSDLGCVDGTEAAWFIARPVDVGVRVRDLRRTNGHLVVVASALRTRDRARRAWTISVEHADANGERTRDDLRAAVRASLDALGIDGHLE